MLQNRYRQKFDSIPADPDFRRRLDDKVNAAKHFPIPRRKTPATAIIVLIALLILATGALAASGALKAIFQQDIDAQTMDFTRMNDHSTADPLVKTLEFTHGSSSVIRLEQAYYNGSQIALAWSLQRAPAELRFIDETDFVPAANQSRAYSLYSWITPDAQQEFERRYSETGFACVTRTQCYMDDGLYFADASLLPADPSDAEFLLFDTELMGSRTCWDEGSIAYCFETSSNKPLPAIAQDQDSLSVTRYVYGVVTYFYRDSTGMYSGSFEKQCIPVTAKIVQTDSYAAQDIHLQADFPIHSADIHLTISPIQCNLSISNQLSQRQQDIWDSAAPEIQYRMIDLPLNLAEDLPVRYDIFIDGTQLPQSPYWYDAYGDEVQFVLPADAQTIVIRPVYANSGAHADEDVVIDLNQPEQ